MWETRPRIAEIAAGIFGLETGRGITESNVYFVGAASGWVLIDTAWRRQAATIREWAERVFGARTRPRAIFLTHLHPDHSGAALELARGWQVPVWVHPDELPFAAGGYNADYANPLDRTVVAPMLRLVPRRKLERMQQRNSLEGVARAFGDAVDLPGLPGWEAIPTPGHTPGHVSFFRPEGRILISGDALVTVRLNSLAGMLAERPGLSGPPWHTTWDRQSAIRSIATLADLRPEVLAGGHGKPWVGPSVATALTAFADEIRHG